MQPYHVRAHLAAPIRWLVACPIVWSSAANLRRLLEVQRNGDWGSPATYGSTSASKSVLSVVSFCAVFLRPPPGLRICAAPLRFWADSNSLIPRLMVERELAMARSTNAMPPCPIDFASVAAHSLRLRSVSADAT